MTFLEVLVAVCTTLTIVLMIYVIGSVVSQNRQIRRQREINDRRYNQLLARVRRLEHRNSREKGVDAK